jgi:hypothetical protein
MKEHLKSNPADKVSVAIVIDENDDQEAQHIVYLINERQDILEGCLVVSRGYGVTLETGQKMETSTLRHYLENVDAKCAQKIEPIMPELFGLNNEYWVSFWIKEVMHDKRYIFLPESIKEENFVFIPMLNKKGIVIE